MKKSRVFLTLVLIFLLSGLIYQTRADMGPKATSEVLVIGLDEAYYFDVLFEVGESSVTVLSETEIQKELEYDYYREDFPDVLNGYRDSDGFASYTLYSNSPHSITRVEGNNHLYHLGYFVPPDTFKVVIITDAGTMFVSEIINKKAFQASFEYDLTNISLVDGQDTYLNVGTIQEISNVNFGSLVFLILVLIVVTLITELLILLAFGYKEKKAYIKVGVVNIGTQLMLQLLIFYGYIYVSSFFGALSFLLIGEIIVLIIEVIAHRLILKERSKTRATVYAFVANIISFVLGLLSIGYLANLIG